MLRCGGDRVVIVGGGIAGALLAKTLESHADVVLIDPKEYFEIPWANLRAKMEPAAVERTVIPHTEYLHHAKVVTASAVSVDDSVVLTSGGGGAVAYDFLVIATGRMCNRPQRRDDRLRMFEHDKARIASSNSILIVGGGPIGVELAAEIVMANPEKHVTIVHGGPRLLMVMGEKASSKALEWLKSKHVVVLLDQTVDVTAAAGENVNVFTTSAGETVNADCHFVCTGRPVASGWLKDSFLGEHVDGEGRLMVDEHLRVGRLRNVFAVGDITDVPEAKQGYLAQRHAMVVSRNLKLLVKDGGGKTAEQKLHRYKASKAAITVTLGRRDALSELPFMTVIGHIPGVVKPRDLFISRTRRMMGLKLSTRHDQSMLQREQH
uniref:FAD/NAD(P)-binding domain-containing protein n=1 Tax=Leersia perrieri TaxID=77586 RepID=A0A0D9XP98_9ORYZ